MICSKTMALLVASGLFLAACSSANEIVVIEPNDSDDVKSVVLAGHAQQVYDQYAAAARDAKAMRAAINIFVNQPTAQTLQTAKQAWLTARETYGLTEAHRFYNGPIDGINETTGEEGPEALLNSWPVNEAYIDYVKGNPNAGIINSDAKLTPGSIADRNQVEDEADVTTGYHAIEFLLWGQDFSADAPGDRPVTDYSDHTSAKRRAVYLIAVTDKLVANLDSLVDAWKPGHDNYRNVFLAMPSEDALSKLMSAQATLAGFELASERIAVPLESGDQEDEHSCFSDNTHRDYIQNIAGIAEVWNGPSGDSLGLKAVIAASSPGNAAKVAKHLDEAIALAQRVESLGPVDRILVSDQCSAGWRALDDLSDELVDLAVALVQAGEAAGLKVEIGGE